MTKATKAKKKSSGKKQAKKTVSWGDAMKRALAEKGSASQGPKQPKPRDSGTYKVRKDAF